MNILYEDSHILAVDKPADLMVHGDGKVRDPVLPTVADWFASQHPDSRSVGEEPITTKEGTTIERPGIVHRLDRDTSGVMLLAKTQNGYDHLKSQFMDRVVEKTYTAICYGHLKQDSYVVETEIGRSKTFGRWTAITKAMRGKEREAITAIAVLNRFSKDGSPYSLVQAKPKTGRTHQIRVHLQYLNYPIVADALYAGKRNDPDHNLGLTRHALHASEISFADLTGTKQTVQSPLAHDLMQAMDNTKAIEKGDQEYL